MIILKLLIIPDNLSVREFVPSLIDSVSISTIVVTESVVSSASRGSSIQWGS